MFGIVWGIILVATGLGYLASPRFVTWTLTKDNSGQRWALSLGERAPFILRFIFGPVLIAMGLVAFGLVFI